MPTVKPLLMGSLMMNTGNSVIRILKMMKFHVPVAENGCL